MAQGGRSYVAGRFALMIDGFKNYGFLREVGGGAIKADVIEQSSGLEPLPKKHIGGARYEDISLKVGMSMAPSMYDWIRSSWNKTTLRKTGAIVSCDYDYKAEVVREFDHALIAETTLPELNGSSKEAANMEVKIAPEVIRVKKGDGRQVQGEFGRNQQKLWTCANFRFEMGDLPCRTVNKVDKLTLKQKIIEDEVGDLSQEGQKSPCKLQVPNLKIQLGHGDAQAWWAWQEDFIIKGNCAEEFEKTARLAYLSQNLKELAWIELRNVGLVSVQDSKSEANLEQIKRIDVEMYVEFIDLHFNAGSAVV